jgi:hypothetical protein
VKPGNGPFFKPLHDRKTGKTQYIGRVKVAVSKEQAKELGLTITDKEQWNRVRSLRFLLELDPNGRLCVFQYVSTSQRKKRTSNSVSNKVRAKWKRENADRKKHRLGSQKVVDVPPLKPRPKKEPATTFAKVVRLPPDPSVDAFGLPETE